MAGKSLIATALCRHFARCGVRVAPFKAQNMSNNARVVAGGEIGVAQYLQARAARVEPDVRMNPVLLKPESDTRSQVVVHGVVDPELGALPWRERADRLWPAAQASLASLQAEFELVILEGAGSPAEINLTGVDMTNLRAARAADAAVLLVCDIDRGGAFAHLYGTWALMTPDDRARIAGFVLNRFRGDPSLLAPAPALLRKRTGVPTLGVVPWLHHGLPDEDGAAEPAMAPDDGRPLVAIVRYPAASNLDEYKVLEQVARVRWVRTPGALGGADLVVLPGSKHVTADLAWLRETGLDEALVARARSGVRLLGICGGLQLLGVELRDGGGGEVDAAGLGLLALRTVFGPRKRTERVSVRFGPLTAPWSALGRLALNGYEIRQGETVPLGAGPVAALPGGRGWAAGSVLGVSVHGLLEDPAVLAALVGAAPERTLDAALDDLADGVMAGLDTAAVEALTGQAG